MNNNKQQKVNYLSEKISGLRYELTLKETDLYFTKERFNKSFDDKDIERIKALNTEINEINSQLSPLVTELRGLQRLYYVEYEVEMINIWTNQPEIDRYRQYLWFNTDTEIDTVKNGWDLQSQPIDNLIHELCDYLQLKFDKFTILQIKSALKK